jgi:hypothetical protein
LGKHTLTNTYVLMQNAGRHAKQSSMDAVPGRKKTSDKVLTIEPHAARCAGARGPALSPTRPPTMGPVTCIHGPWSHVFASGASIQHSNLNEQCFQRSVPGACYLSLLKASCDHANLMNNQIRMCVFRVLLPTETLGYQT